MRIEMYQELFQNFIEGSLSTKSFETAFLEAFRAEPPDMNVELYIILESVFESLDNY